MIANLIKPKKSRYYRLRFRLKPSDGKIEEINLKTTDKQVAEKLKSEIIREREYEQAGFLPPKQLREASAIPIEIHLDDYLKDLRRRGRAPKYVDNIETRINLLSKECQWQTIRDVKAADILNWRIDNDRHQKTLNDYLQIIKSFFKWLVKFDRATCNPLEQIEPIFVTQERSRVRRAMAQPEITKLIAVSEEYRLVYLMALYTGLRRGEMEDLCWNDVILKGKRPYLTIRFQDTKNRKIARIPIHPDLASELLREYKKGYKTSDPVFKQIPRVDRIKRDLKKAGINFKDEEGRVIDLHAFRMTFGTSLATNNTPDRTQMDAMRLSDRKLLDFVYTDTKQIGTEAAISSLPSYLNQPVPQIVPQKSVSAGLQVSQLDTNAFQMSVSQSADNEQVLHGLTGPGTMWQKEENGARCRVRTCSASSPTNLKFGKAGIQHRVKVFHAFFGFVSHVR